MLKHALKADSVVGGGLSGLREERPTKPIDGMAALGARSGGRAWSSAGGGIELHVDPLQVSLASQTAECSRGLIVNKTKKDFKASATRHYDRR